MQLKRSNAMTTYLFPGQGSQVKGMGGALFDKFGSMTQAADDILGYSIKSLCLNNPENKLNQTQYTQPALYVVNALSYAQKIHENGLKPHFVAGHSLGEYNALQASGAISFENGLKLVAKRGELMALATKGGMAAVLGLTEDEILRHLQESKLTSIDIANANSSTQTVISGLSTDLDKAARVFEKAGARFVALNTSGAFHSRYMAPAKKAFEKYIEQFQWGKFTMPVIANVNARPYKESQIPQNLAEQITGSVRWLDSMNYLLEQGESEFEELGSGMVLTKLMVTIKERFNAVRLPSEAEGLLDIPEKQNVLHERVFDWNNRFPIGTKVKVKGYAKMLESRSEARLLFKHRAAIYLSSYNGYFDLDDVTPVAG